MASMSCFLSFCFLSFTVLRYLFSWPCALIVMCFCFPYLCLGLCLLCWCSCPFVTSWFPSSCLLNHWSHLCLVILLVLCIKSLCFFSWCSVIVCVTSMLSHCTIPMCTFLRVSKDSPLYFNCASYHAFMSSSTPVCRVTWHTWLWCFSLCYAAMHMAKASPHLIDFEESVLHHFLLKTDSHCAVWTPHSDERTG